MSDVKTNEGVPALALNLDLDVGMEEGRRGLAAAAGCLEDPVLKVLREAAGDPQPLTGEQRTQAHRHVAMWRGRELQPWSLEREIFWRDLRVKANSPGLDEMLSLNDFLPEAVRVIFTADQPVDVLKRLRLVDRLVLLRAVDAWAVVNVGLEDAEQMCEVAQEILQAVARVRSGAMETGGGEDLDGVGE